MSTVRKGRRNERECAKYFQSAGYEVAKSQHTRYGDTDLFNAFDVLAFKPGKKPKAVQVKTNKFSGKKDFLNEIDGTVPFEHVDVYCWIRHDREGWEIRKYENPLVSGDIVETKELDEREISCKIGQEAASYVENL